MRIQLDLDPQGVEIIQELKQNTGLRTHKELFNTAITVLHWAVEQQLKGRIVASLDEESENYRELQMPALDRAAALGKSRRKGKPAAKVVTAQRRR